MAYSLPEAWPRQDGLHSPGGLAPLGWPTLSQRPGPAGMAYILLEVCAVQEGHESYEVGAKTSACHQILGSPSKEPHPQSPMGTEHAVTYRWARSPSGAGRTLEEEENSEALIKRLPSSPTRGSWSRPKTQGQW